MDNKRIFSVSKSVREEDEQHLKKLVELRNRLEKKVKKKEISSNI